MRKRQYGFLSTLFVVMTLAACGRSDQEKSAEQSAVNVNDWSDWKETPYSEFEANFGKGKDIGSGVHVYLHHGPWGDVLVSVVNGKIVSITPSIETPNDQANRKTIGKRVRTIFMADKRGAAKFDREIVEFLRRRFG